MRKLSRDPWSTARLQFVSKYAGGRAWNEGSENPGAAGLLTWCRTLSWWQAQRARGDISRYGKTMRFETWQSLGSGEGLDLGRRVRVYWAGKESARLSCRRMQRNTTGQQSVAARRSLQCHRMDELRGVLCAPGVLIGEAIPKS